MEKEINVNVRCQEIYEEIEITRSRLCLDLKTLCNKSFQCCEDYDLDNPKEEKKHYEKYKKIFHRKNWNEEKANERTFQNLEKLRESLYKTDEYKSKEGGLLKHKDKKAMQKISEELEQVLNSQDYIE